MQKYEKLWTRNFILAIFANMFTGFIFYLLMTTLAVYATSKFNAPSGVAGLTASIYVLGSLVGRIFTGKYIESIGRRKTMYIGGFTFFLVSLLYLIPVGLPMLLAIRLLHGMTFGIINTALPTIVISYIPDNRRGEGLGFFTVSTTFSTAIGPFLGVYILEHYDFSVMFVLCAAFALGTLLFLLPMKVTNPVEDMRADAIRGGNMGLKSFFEMKTVPIAIIVLAMGIVYASVTSFITSYAADLNLSYVVSIYFIVYSVCILIGRPLTGKILDRFGDNIAMIPTIISASISLAVLAFARSLPAFLVSGALMAFGLGTVISVGQAIAVKLAPKERVGTAISTYLSFSDIGLGIGPVIMGMIIPWKGYSGMYLIGSAIIAADLVLYIFIHGRKYRKK
jgi:MFS family permease